MFWGRRWRPGRYALGYTGLGVASSFGGAVMLDLLTDAAGAATVRAAKPLPFRRSRSLRRIQATAGHSARTTRYETYAAHTRPYRSASTPEILDRQRSFEDDAVRAAMWYASRGGRRQDGRFLGGASGRVITRATAAHLDGRSTGSHHALATT